MKHDYMKYYRVVRFYAKKKYDLGQPDLEMLFFLYSEKIFKKENFDDYNELFPWDKKRFARLLKEGWIEYYRKTSVHKKANLYQLTRKGRRIIKELYELMDGTAFSEDHRSNPLFGSDLDFSSKVYRNFIKRLNLRQAQRP